ncbi:hypothetical protein [Leptolyngbya sp. FACHB-261]|uniref:hypothetical protein n=1 Tax=Leptolyngbya sp. FACHB-261 TaxID=2692806 RepID=UPI001685C8CD|nr:hypothetical protein [Leptolyngbya sp. FACHB-261]MBD2104119.1 hypothetical protein [Leptolyngbya sp. FACHB-261]
MSKRRRRRAPTPGAAGIPGQIEGAEPQSAERSCQSDSVLHDKAVAEAVGLESGLRDSCQRVWRH